MNSPAPFLAQPIAHRGFHDRASGILENSASAFDRAIAHGFAIECDLQLTGDDVPVVFHDPTLDRLTGQSGNVRSISAGQLTRIPLKGSASGDCPQRFSTFLEQVAGRVPLVVELKHQKGDATAALAARVVDAIRGYDGPIAFKSFDPRLLTALRTAGYEGPLGIITYRYDDEEARQGTNPLQRIWLRGLAHFPMTRFNFISCDHLALTMPSIRLFHRLGFPVMTWTIKSREAAGDALQHADQIVFEGFDPTSD
ncbi:MAG TPA: glycerophosphodiester phosphodiesterase family protein [Devosiaceae bacterium]